jgi:amidase
MQIITADRLICSYDRSHAPCATVALEELFVIETHDRIPVMAQADRLVGSFKDPFNSIYAVTGPVYITGTGPGDTLRVDVLDLTLTDDRGIICAQPKRGGFGDQITRSQARIVEIRGSEIRFSDQISVPANPHIGKVATTPAGGPVPTGIPGPHGGNMDNKHLTTGSSILLPIFVEGALLSVGDLHAAMGDGESNSSGVEATGRVTLRCRVVRDISLEQPLVITQAEVQMLGHGPTLDEASRMALDQMARLLARELKMDYEDAAMLISIAGDLHVCQIANPLVGVRVSMRREMFAASRWL